ncbi:hypothetical protein ATCC90586_003925 [Pythium insidiosum]|nr:hypothetical protein ATCC90586_003925 [Pythium insidiosum]
MVHQPPTTHDAALVRHVSGWVYGQVQSVEGAKIVVQRTGGGTFSGRTASAHRIDPIIAILFGHAPSSSPKTLSAVRGTHATVLSRLLGDPTTPRVRPTRDIAKLLEGIVSTDDLPQGDALCSWRDPETGMRHEFPLQHAIDHVFVNKSSATRISKAIRSGVGPKFFLPHERARPTYSQAPHNQHAPGTPAPDSIFDDASDDDQADSLLEQPPQPHLSPPDDDEVSVLRALVAYPDVLKSYIAARAQAIAPRADQREHAGSINGNVTARQVQKRSTTIATEPSTSVPHAALSPTGASGCTAWDNATIAGEPPGPKRLRTDDLSDGPFMREAFSTTPLQRRAHALLYDTAVTGTSPQEFVKSLLAHGLVGFAPHPAVLSRLYDFQFGILGLSIMHLLQLDPTEKMEWVLSTKARATKVNMQNFSRAVDLPPVTMPATMDQIMKALAGLKVYCDAFGSSLTCRLVQALHTATRDTLGLEFWEAADLKYLIYWIDSMLERYSIAVGNDARSGGESRAEVGQQHRRHFVPLAPRVQLGLLRDLLLRQRVVQRGLDAELARSNVSLSSLVRLVRCETADDTRPNKALNPDTYALLLAGYEHLDVMIRVARFGFRAEWIPQTRPARPSPNHRSAISQARSVAARILEGEAAGTYLVVDEDLLAKWGVTVSPFGAIRKDDAKDTQAIRLIHDLAFPSHNNVNDHTIKESLPPLAYESTVALAQRIECLHRHYPGTQILMLKGDVQGAFRHLPDKIAKALQRVRPAQGAARVPTLTLLKLLGSLRHVASCLRAAKPFYQRLHGAAARAPRHGMVALSTRTRDDLLWFETILHHGRLTGIPTYLFGSLPQPDVHLYMDASGDVINTMGQQHRRHFVPLAPRVQLGLLRDLLLRQRVVQRGLDAELARSNVSLSSLVRLVRCETADDTRPNKALNPDTYALLLAGYEHLDVMIRVARFGFRAEWIPQTRPARPSPNHRSAISQARSVAARILEGEAAGTYLVVDEDLLAKWGVTVSPFGAIRKDDAKDTQAIRLIHDLAFPSHNNVNDHTIKESLPPLAYESTVALAQRIECLHRHYPGTQILMLKGDVQGAFRHLPDKIAKALQRVRPAQGAARVPTLTLLKLLGSLRHVASCLRAAKPFYQRLHGAAARAPRHGMVALSTRTRDDLLWFETILHHGRLTGIPTYLFGSLPQPDVHLYMDASGDGLCVLDPAGERYIIVAFDDDERADPNFDINPLGIIFKKAKGSGCQFKGGILDAFDRT